MRFLIFGKNGQLATELLKMHPKALCFDHKQAPFENPNLVLSVLEANKNQFDALLCCSAYTAVDLAEKEKELAFKINAHTPEIITAWCQSNNKLMISFSTDYVFDGKKQNAYITTDPTNPINVYGESKLLGEESVLRNCGHVIRTSWMVSPWSKNFVKTIWKLIHEKEILRVVDDQMGCLTFASSLAFFTTKLAHFLQNTPDLRSQGSLWHWCDGPEATWYEVAKEILDVGNSWSKEKQGIVCKEIQPISTKEYPTPAQRPLFSVLDCSLSLNQIRSVRQTNWKLGVSDLVKIISSKAKDPGY